MRALRVPGICFRSNLFAARRAKLPQLQQRFSSPSSVLTGKIACVVKEANEVADLYTKWGSDTYDDDVHKWGYQLPDLAVKYAKSVIGEKAFEGKRLLDGGAGTGLLSLCLKDAGIREATAIDISPEMLSKAMRSGFYSCCKVVDLKRDFAFADNEFDMSLCLGTLTYMEPADLTLAELCRVTKPGGYVGFSMRTDLCEKWESALQSFVDKKIWTHMGTSEGFDYLPANPEYGNTILVKVYIYKVL